MEKENPPCLYEVYSVVSRLQKHGEPSNLANICNELKSMGVNRKQVLASLDFLEKQGKLDKAADRQYIVNETPTEQPAT
jgi:hypothetical protein